MKEGRRAFGIFLLGAATFPPFSLRSLSLSPGALHLVILLLFSLRFFLLPLPLMLQGECVSASLFCYLSFFCYSYYSCPLLARRFAIEGAFRERRERRRRKDYSPSLDIPTAMHFFRRQYWQRLRLILKIEHCWFLVQGLYWIFCWMLRRKKPCELRKRRRERRGGKGTERREREGESKSLERERERQQSKASRRRFL